MFEKYKRPWFESHANHCFCCYQHSDFPDRIGEITFWAGNGDPIKFWAHWKHMKNWKVPSSKTQITGVPFDLFWNCLPEIKWFGYLLAFFNVEKIAYIRTCFQKNLSKSCNILYEILILNLVFKENLAFILKLLMTKFDLFRTWQPCQTLGGWH